jgi:hypothetical protein
MFMISEYCPLSKGGLKEDETKEHFECNRETACDQNRFKNHE